MGQGLSIVRPLVYSDAVLTATNVTEAETLWSAAATYALDAAVYLIEDGVHQRYVSLAGSNLNKPPATSPTWWRSEGATNRWAMFDASSSSGTSRATSIDVTLTLPASERADTLYLQGLDARTVRVQVTDPLAGAVYDQTFSLADPGIITDWYAWMFEPVVFKTELLVTGLPNGAGSVITVTITSTGGTAVCGNAVVGQRQFIGLTRWGAKTEIRDYSVFDDDAFGNRVFIPRAYRRLTSAEILIENRVKDSVEDLLAAARASVRLYIFDEDYRSLNVLGTARWSGGMDLAPTYSVHSFQAESIV